MKNFIIKIMVMLAFLLISSFIILVYSSERVYLSAKKLHSQSQLKKAEENYLLSKKLDPTNLAYYCGLADFYEKQSYENRNKESFLQKAKDLYSEALLLNPENSFCWYKLGRIYLKEGELEKEKNKDDNQLTNVQDDNSFQRHLERERKLLKIDEAIELFRRAIEHEPNGSHIADSVGYSVIKKWKQLNMSEREFAKERLRFVLASRPWETYRIMSLVWTNTMSFSLLKEVTPQAIWYQNKLLDFMLQKKELTAYAEEQSKFVNQLEKQIKAENLPKNKKEKLELIQEMKKNSDSKRIMPAETVEKTDWQSISKKDMEGYENGNMYWQGTILSLINIPAGKIFVKIQAKGEQADGVYPFMQVELDGQVIGEEFVDSEDWKEYFFEVDEQGGTKVLSITFLNDGGNEEKKEDRNLYVGRAWVEKIENDK
jgi:tetratricopeptide (TPR) repeat protein